MSSIYLIGSLRNPIIPDIGNALRALGHDVFDDWFAAGPIADDSWQEYETRRGRSYAEALAGLAAEHVFEFDDKHLTRCSTAVLVLPAGKSGHIEWGRMVGSKKPGFVLFDKMPERWDVMYRYASGVFFSLDEMLIAFGKKDR